MRPAAPTPHMSRVRRGERGLRPHTGRVGLAFSRQERGSSGWPAKHTYRAPQSPASIGRLASLLSPQPPGRPQAPDGENEKSEHNRPGNSLQHASQCSVDLRARNHNLVWPNTEGQVASERIDTPLATERGTSLCSDSARKWKSLYRDNGIRCGKRSDSVERHEGNLTCCIVFRGNPHPAVCA
jgi:hypothetical protein